MYAKLAVAKSGVPASGFGAKQNPKSWKRGAYVPAVTPILRYLVWAGSVPISMQLGPRVYPLT